MSYLLAECSFEKKKYFLKIVLLRHPKYCWDIIFKIRNLWKLSEKSWAKFYI